MLQAAKPPYARQWPSQSWLEQPETPGRARAPPWTLAVPLRFVPAARCVPGGTGGEKRTERPTRSALFDAAAPLVSAKPSPPHPKIKSESISSDNIKLNLWSDLLFMRGNLLILNSNYIQIFIHRIQKCLEFHFRQLYNQDTEGRIYFYPL